MDINAECMERVNALCADLADENPDAIRFDNLDAAVLGIARQHAGAAPVLCYSERLIIEELANQFSDAENPREAAVEWYDANVACLAVGTGTPVIITDEIGDE